MGNWGKAGRGFAGYSFVQMRRYNPSEEDDLREFVLSTSRVSRVVEGGKRYSYQVLSVIGDGNGHFGFAVGRAAEAPDAMRKASARARRRMLGVPLIRGTISHEVEGRFSSARVILKPAAPGTGIIAGGTVRAICEAVGIQNILTKSLGSNNPHNLAKAMVDAFSKLRTVSETAKLRGKKFSEIIEKEKKVSEQQKQSEIST